MSGLHCGSHSFFWLLWNVDLPWFKSPALMAAYMYLQLFHPRFGSELGKSPLLVFHIPTQGMWGLVFPLFGPHSPAHLRISLWAQGCPQLVSAVWPKSEVGSVCGTGHWGCQGRLSVGVYLFLFDFSEASNKQVEKGNMRLGEGGGNEKWEKRHEHTQHFLLKGVQIWIQK